MTTTIKIDPVTRIEGHARVLLDCDDEGKVDEAHFCVNELRGFERILLGMEAHTLPQVTARICGVCPTAHHLVAAKALDNCAGVEIPEAAKLLRELMYMGHVIHSHALSLFVLAGPDLVFGLGGDSATQNIVGMAEREPELTQKGLRLRTLGQKINEVIGGRGIHPVTAVAGGLSFSLSDGQCKRLQDLSVEALSLVKELFGRTRDLLLGLFDSNPELLSQLNIPTWYMGSVNPGGGLSFYDGTLRVVDDKGVLQKEFQSSEYKDYIVERAVTNSYAKEVYFLHGGKEHMYRVSNLARFNVIDGIDTPLAHTEFEKFRENFGRPCHNAVIQMYAKLVELMYACEHAVELSSNAAIRGVTRIAAPIKAGRGVAHIEAPRGTLIHDYEIDDKGIVRAANMIIATQQNTAAINASIKEGANSLPSIDAGSKMLNGIEFIVRCYDPCLACSTHAIGQMGLDIEVRQKGEVVKRIQRGSHA
ncbi:Ni/Fe hydrogenase subunit alpha [Desulforhopalus sp. 52FAK]